MIVRELNNIYILNGLGLLHETEPERIPLGLGWGRPPVGSVPAGLEVSRAVHSPRGAAAQDL